MNILVSGSGSFLGRTLCPLLLERGHSVYGISRQNCNLSSVFCGDICDENFYDQIDVHIDALIHLAAVTTPPFSDPSLLYYNNIEGGRLLFRFCESRRVRKIIYASSTSVYGDIQGTTLTEETPIHNPTPYGISKLVPEILLKEMSGLSSFSLRLPAIIGKGATRHFWSQVVDCVLTGRSFNIYNPNSNFNGIISRENLSDFICSLLERDHDGHQTCNIAACSPISILSCIQKIGKLLSREPHFEMITSNNSSHTIDIQKAESYGFKPWTVDHSFQHWLGKNATR